MADGIDLARRDSFSLGAAKVSPATLEVAGPHATVTIERLVMQVLLTMVDADGEVVTRDDLTARCWGGRIVGDDAINRTLSKVRRLSGEVAAGSFTLQTIPKVGYRLIALESPTAQPELGPAHPQVGERRVRYSRRTVVGAAIGGLAAAGAATALALRDTDDGASAEAAALYEQGLDATRLGMPDGNAQAIGFLKQAVAIDPRFEKAWSALALAYQVAAESGPPEAIEASSILARSAAGRAIALNPRAADAHAAIALLKPSYRNWIAVEAGYRRILQIDPANVAIGKAYARLLMEVGRVGEAVAMIGLVVDRDRFSPLLQWRRGWALWIAGRVEEADQVIDRALALWPRLYTVWACRFWIFAYTGRGTAAIAMAKDEASRPPGVPAWNYDLLVAEATALVSRSPADIDAAIGAVTTAARRGAVFAENAIMTAAALGRVNDAFGFCDGYFFGRGFAVGPRFRTAEEGQFMTPARRNTALLFTPPTARLRADPRFDALTVETGLADYWRQTGSRPDPFRR